jgi:hypothetical protein
MSTLVESIKTPLGYILSCNIDLVEIDELEELKL